jgi:prolyl-tRNA synthetase
MLNQNENPSSWYSHIVRISGLADPSPVRGCMVIKPYGYELWTQFSRLLNKKLEDNQYQNAYFPLLIPNDLFETSISHIENFSPSNLLVTQAGLETLQNPLVLRPSSEAMVSYMFARWIESYNDLPVRINQWANVFRWENSTNPFLRTMEILWQESHSAHRSHDEALSETIHMIKLYADFAKQEAALPVIWGQKSSNQSFAGALTTYSLDTMMPDGKALQLGASYDLGQNMARIFNMKYCDEEGISHCCWSTNCGMSARMIGAIVQVHGDNYGLRLPPKIAPIQVVIIPIGKGKIPDEILHNANHMKNTLNQGGIRTFLDDNKQHSVGWKFNNWELKGVPLRIEIGRRELANQTVTIARRDMDIEHNRTTFKQSVLLAQTKQMLANVQESLYRQALNRFKTNIHQPKDIYELHECVQNGWGQAWWCGRESCEIDIKENTGAKIRSILRDSNQQIGQCVNCQQASNTRAYFARGF